jgi:hypothetical protein
MLPSNIRNTIDYYLTRGVSWEEAIKVTQITKQKLEKHKNSPEFYDYFLHKSNEIKQKYNDKTYATINKTVSFFLEVMENKRYPIRERMRAAENLIRHYEKNLFNKPIEQQTNQKKVTSEKIAQMRLDLYGLIDGENDIN